MTDGPGTNVPAPNLPEGVAGKLREILTNLEAKDSLTVAETGKIDFSMMEGGTLWKVSYDTSAQ